MRVCAAGGTLDGDGAGVGCVAGRSVLALLETKNDDDDRGEQTGFLPERLMVWLVLRLTGFRSNHWRVEKSSQVHFLENLQNLESFRRLKSSLFKFVFPMNRFWFSDEMRRETGKTGGERGSKT